MKYDLASLHFNPSTWDELETAFGVDLNEARRAEIMEVVDQFVVASHFRTVDDARRKLRGSTKHTTSLRKLRGRIEREIDFAEGSIGNIVCSSLGLQLDISSGTSLAVANNDLSTANVRALGSNTNNIDLRNQYWGTTNETQIESRIEHQVDSPNLPLVLFRPLLSSTPLPCDTSLTVTSIVPTSTGFVAHFNDDPSSLC